MNPAPADLRVAPPVFQLAAILAIGDGATEDLRKLVVAGAMDWPPLLRLAGDHLVTPSLAGVLRHKGLFARLPSDVQTYLDTMQLLNRARNDVLRGQLAGIAAALNKIGIEPVLLKGANALLPNQYTGAEDRVIGDLDILVPANRHADAEAAIVGLGFEAHIEPFATAASLARQHHGAALLHGSLPVTVETHRRLLPEARDSALLERRLVSQAIALEVDAVVRAPDPATRLLHNYLHAQIVHLGARRHILDLRQLLEFAALANDRADAWDAPKLLSRLHPARQPGLALYFALAERWLGLAWPTNLPRAPRQSIKLWGVEQAATNNRVAWLIKLKEFIRTLPWRLARLIPRVAANPSYFPWRLRQFINKNFGRPAQ